MLRYQQQYSFFDASKLGKAIRFTNLSDVVMDHDLDAVLAEIIKQVREVSPAVVVVDSFRTVVRKTMANAGELEMQSFIQRLAQFLSTWEATTFLVGEYEKEEMRDNPLFTVADGLFWLSQMTERNSVVRKFQILKLRGQTSVPGLHAFHIRESGLQAFPRSLGREGKEKGRVFGKSRLAMDIPELDRMMSGGVLEGDSLLVAGPSGTGKSVLATQFIAAGLKLGQPAVMALFEERPWGYTHRADALGLKLESGAEKRQTGMSLPPAAGPFGRSNHSRDLGRGGAGRRQTTGDRLPGWFRNGPRAGFSR